MEQTQRWERVKELFGEALQLAPAQRSAFLVHACGSDESLLTEINSLLAAHDDADSLSESPWQGQFAAAMRVPIAIGPYQLVRRIGEGGMGEVWLAQQTTPVKRQVALKLIRAGMSSDSLLQRFEWERQSLAMMDHPAIAKVFEAGSTPTGQPLGRVSLEEKRILYDGRVSMRRLVQLAREAQKPETEECMRLC